MARSVCDVLAACTEGQRAPGVLFRNLAIAANRIHSVFGQERWGRNTNFMRREAWGGLPHCAAGSRRGGQRRGENRRHPDHMIPRNLGTFFHMIPYKKVYKCSGSERQL